MQVPSILQGERPFDLIKGGIAGAILIIAVGFNWAGYGFGWTLGSTAEQKVNNAGEAAIVRVLAPICADKFRQASDSSAKLLTQVKEATEHKRPHLSENLIRPGWVA